MFGFLIRISALNAITGPLELRTLHHMCACFLRCAVWDDSNYDSVYILQFDGSAVVSSFAVSAKNITAA